jgi:hypothetical protein
MTFDEIKALTDEAALEILKYTYRLTSEEVSGDLAIVLEERLRERYRNVEFRYERGEETIVRLGPWKLSWPAPTDPRRVRVDAYLWACGSAGVLVQPDQLLQLERRVRGDQGEV